MVIYLQLWLDLVYLFFKTLHEFRLLFQGENTLYIENSQLYYFETLGTQHVFSSRLGRLWEHEAMTETLRHSSPLGQVWDHKVSKLKLLNEMILKFQDCADLSPALLIKTLLTPGSPSNVNVTWHYQGSSECACFFHV